MDSCWLRKGRLITQTWLDILATAGVSALVALAIAACFYIYASMDLRDTEQNLKKATDDPDITVASERLRHASSDITERVYITRAKKARPLR